MKILYHHRTRAEDAQGIHISEMIHAFRLLGHQVEVAGLLGPTKQNKKQGKVAATLSSFAARVPALVLELMEIFYNLYGFYLLRKKIKAFNPDFIYERYALYNISGVIASKLYKIPLIEEVNAPLAYEKSKYANLILTGIASFFEKKICCSATKTVVVSGPLKKILIKNGVPAEQIEIIPNGVNPTIFNPDVDPDVIRKKNHLENKIILGFVGWFKKWHGLEELIQTYAKNQLQKKNICLLLVGDGPACQDLVAISKHHGIYGTGVVFTGPVDRDDIPLYIAAFDLGLQPDVTEYASPIKLFEYISMGKGVIAPDKENITEILSENYQGLFKAADWQSMGETINTVAESPAHLKALGRETYSLFKQKKYLWVENAKKTIALIQK